MLGICLGHQTLAAALGGNIIRAKTPMHGRTSIVEHKASELFEGIPSPLTVCRYHSLVVDPTTLPEELQTSANCAEGSIMALQHRTYPVFGVQFHPEAVLTEHGYQLLANFLSLAGLKTQAEVGMLQAAECRTTPQEPPTLPQQPVTF